MPLTGSIKTVIQCDFDGTITEKDVSFFLLDAFAQGDWRQLLQEYKEHKISVAYFNTKAFSMVKADEETLLGAIRDKAKIRAGFQELIAYCSRRDFRLVIVSNGLDFYIKAILKDIGLENLEVHAAQTQFYPEGLVVKYIRPDGKQSDNGLKETYIKLFLSQGYRVIYIGNGDSDVFPAKYAHQVFARSQLLTYCRENNLRCKPFNDLTDIIRALDPL